MLSDEQYNFAIYQYYLNYTTLTHKQIMKKIKQIRKQRKKEKKKLC